MNKERQGVMKRNRVVLNKTSLDLLNELNGFAKNVDAYITIAVNKEGEPIYVINRGDCDKSVVVATAKTKEEVLEKLIAHLSQAIG